MPSIRWHAMAALAACSCLLAPAASGADGAAVPDPFSDRGGGLSPVLRYLQTQDIALVSLGRAAGVPGYLARDAGGKWQAVYVADAEHAVAGMLYRSGGTNVTSRQIGEMIVRFADAAEKSGAGKVERPDLGADGQGKGPIVDWFRSQGLEVTDIALDEGGLDAVLVQAPAKGGPVRKAQVFYVVPSAPEYAFAGLMLRDGGTNVTGLQIADLRQRVDLEKATAESGGSKVSASPNKPPAAAAAFAAAPAEKAAPRAADAARFALAGDAASAVADRMKSSSYFSVGKEGAPQVFMVADPNCPFCHETWRRLKPMVTAGEIRLNVVMIAGLQGSDPKARSIVMRPAVPGASASGPALAWLAGEGSVDAVAVKDGPMTGTEEWLEAGRRLDANISILRDLQIGQTPFLAYVGSDGRTYSSVGVPADMTAFLAAL